MGGIDVNVSPVPPQQGQLVQRRATVGIARKEDPFPDAPMQDPVALRRHHPAPIRGGIEPRQAFGQGRPRSGIGLAQWTARIQIQHHRPHGRATGGVQMGGQARQRMAVPFGIDQQFVGIDRDAPMAVAMAKQQRAQPVHPETRASVAARRLPQRNIGLATQEILGPVSAGVIDDQEASDTQPAIMIQEFRQAQHLVPQGCEAKDAVGPDRRRAVRQRGQIPARPQAAPQQFPAFPALAPGRPGPPERRGTVAGHA